MTRLLPQPTDKLNSPSHSFAHRVVSIDSLSPEQSIDIGPDGQVTFGLIKIADGTQGLGKILVSDADGIGHWVLGAGGTTDHALLSHLDFASSGHTGFQPAGTYISSEVDPVWNAQKGSYYTKLEVNSLIPTHLSDLTSDTSHRVVTDTEIGFWNNKQSLIGYTPENVAHKGQNNGYCELDAGGKVPTSRLTTSLLKYISTWDASINDPFLLANDVTKKGNVYITSVAGTQFSIDFALGDWAIYNDNGDIQKSIASNAVVSVNGQTGVVVLEIGDVAGPGAAVDSNFASFDTTTGKLIKDSNYSPSSFQTPLVVNVDYQPPITLTEGSIAFAGADGKITQDNANFFWDNTSKQLLIGNTTLLQGVTSTPLGVIGFSGVEGFLEGYLENLNGDGSTDWVAGNDIDDGTVATGTYIDMGINGSTYIPNIIGVASLANDSYLTANGGNLSIQTFTAGKKIKFGTAGDTTDNIRMEIADDRVSIYANKDNELVPALEAINWTGTNGWSAGTSQLVKVTDIDVGTIEPSSASWVVMGVTYIVNITIAAISGTVTYSIGGTEGTPLALGVHSEYITANTNDKFTITGDVGSTATISSISIRALLHDTGQLFAEGDILIGSQLKSITGSPIMASNGAGITTFAEIPLLPGVDPTIDNQAVRKAYVDTVIQGLLPIASCRCATTVNRTLGTQFQEGDIIDDVTLVHNDRILIKNQTTQSENGIYIVQVSGAPVRATDYNETSEVLRGTYTFIEEGTINIQTQWVEYAPNPINVGVDPILFRQLPSAQIYSATDGIQLIGSQFSTKRLNIGAIILGGIGSDELMVNVDNSSIEILSNQLTIKEEGVTNEMLAGSIANTKLDVITEGGHVQGQALDVLDGIPIGAGVIPIGNLGSGARDGTKYLKDDGTFDNPPGLGDMMKSTYDPNNKNADAFDYNNFINVPFIPTATSQLTNDANFITLDDIPPETDPKVGTLTSDYIPKWGTTTLVDSNISDNGSDITFYADLVSEHNAFFSGHNGNETLNDPNFDTGIPWIALDDFSISGGTVIVLPNTGSGVLQQPSANLAIPLNLNVLYQFTYEVISNDTTIELGIASLPHVLVYTLDLTVGIHTLYFVNRADDFNLLYFLSDNTGTALVLDNFSLKQVTKDGIVAIGEGLTDQLADHPIQLTDYYNTALLVGDSIVGGINTVVNSFVDTFTPNPDNAFYVVARGVNISLPFFDTQILDDIAITGKVVFFQPTTISGYNGGAEVLVDNNFNNAMWGYNGDFALVTVGGYNEFDWTYSSGYGEIYLNHLNYTTLIKPSHWYYLNYTIIDNTTTDGHLNTDNYTFLRYGYSLPSSVGNHNIRVYMTAGSNTQDLKLTFSASNGTFALNWVSLIPILPGNLEVDGEASYLDHPIFFNQNDFIDKQYLDDNYTMSSGLVTASSTTTLTNKRLVPRFDDYLHTSTINSSADTYDAAQMTAMNQGITVNNPPGTPTNFQTMEFRFKDDGTARTIAWGNAFVATFGTSLPTTTVANKIMYLKFSYNTANSLNKWMLMDLKQEV